MLGDRGRWQMKQINRALQDACDEELAVTFVIFYGMGLADAKAAVAAIRAGNLPIAWKPEIVEVEEMG